MKHTDTPQQWLDAMPSRLKWAAAWLIKNEVLDGPLAASLDRDQVLRALTLIQVNPPTTPDGRTVTFEKLRNAWYQHRTHEKNGTASSSLTLPKATLMALEKLAKDLDKPRNKVVDDLIMQASAFEGAAQRKLKEERRERREERRATQQYPDVMADWAQESAAKKEVRILKKQLQAREQLIESLHWACAKYMTIISPDQQSRIDHLEPSLALKAKDINDALAAAYRKEIKAKDRKLRQATALDEETTPEAPLSAPEYPPNEGRSGSGARGAGATTTIPDVVVSTTRPIHDTPEVISVSPEQAPDPSSPPAIAPHGSTATQDTCPDNAQEDGHHATKPVHSSDYHDPLEQKQTGHDTIKVGEWKPLDEAVQAKPEEAESNPGIANSYTDATIAAETNRADTSSDTPSSKPPATGGAQTIVKRSIWVKPRRANTLRLRSELISAPVAPLEQATEQLQPSFKAQFGHVFDSVVDPELGQIKLHPNRTGPNCWKCSRETRLLIEPSDPNIHPALEGYCPVCKVLTIKRQL